MSEHQTKTKSLPVLTPGMDYYRKREYLSISSLGSLNRCPRKFFYSSGVGLKQPISSPALLFGEAWHKAVPMVLAGTTVAEALAAFDEIWDESLADKYRSRANAKHMLESFAATRSPALYELLPPPQTNVQISDRISDWEIPFAVSVPGVPVPLAGRIDGLCRHRETGQLHALEFKTSREVSERLFSGLRLSPQIIAYAAVLRTLLDEPVTGTIVEVARVSTSNFEHTTMPIDVSEAQTDQLFDWLRFLWSQIEFYESSGHFPQNRWGCTSYPGYGTPGYVCDYSSLCEVQDWTAMIDMFDRQIERPFVLDGDNNGDKVSD